MGTEQIVFWILFIGTVPMIAVFTLILWAVEITKWIEYFNKKKENSDGK